jgi:cyclopropane-fatty-acyl-phospholipid synthase
MPKKPTFALRYVFPDGELRPVSATLAVAEKTGFEIRDVESLREHYLMTLQHWGRRLEEHADEARRLTDEVAYRVWRLYMAGSADGFQRGKYNIYQCLLVKPDTGKSGLPLTREDWYR